MGTSILFCLGCERRDGEVSKSSRNKRRVHVGLVVRWVYFSRGFWVAKRGAGLPLKSVVSEGAVYARGGRMGGKVVVERHGRAGVGWWGCRALHLRGTGIRIECFSGLQGERFGDYSDFFGGVGAGATCLDVLAPGGGYRIRESPRIRQFCAL